MAVLPAIALALLSACESSPTPTSVESPATGPRPSLDTSANARFNRVGFSGTTSAPGNITWHSGPVMPTSVTYAIFWGASWNNDPAFYADKKEGIATLLSGLGGTGYWNTLTEYYDNTGGIQNQTTYMGSFVDANTSPPGGIPDSVTLLNEVCSVLAANAVTARTDAVYLLYSTQPATLYRGFHMWAQSPSECGGTEIRIAYLWDLDALQETPAGSHSPGLADLADASTHELAETVTDPLGTAWFADGNEGEISDKCNLTYNPSNNFVTLANGSVWALQGQWSNGANNAGAGFANGNTPAEYGCVTNRVNVGSVTMSGTMSGSQPVAEWTAPAITYGDPNATTYTVHRLISIGGNITEDDWSGYQGTEWMDGNLVVQSYNGSTNPGPHYDWVEYYVDATNTYISRTSGRVYFKCGPFNGGCGPGL
jgi:hypothetical protein